MAEYRITFRSRDVVSTHVRKDGVTIILTTEDGWGHLVEEMIHTAVTMSEIENGGGVAAQICNMLMLENPT